MHIYTTLKHEAPDHNGNAWCLSGWSRLYKAGLFTVLKG